MNKKCQDHTETWKQWGQRFFGTYEVKAQKNFPKMRLQVQRSEKSSGRVIHSLSPYWVQKPPEGCDYRLLKCVYELWWKTSLACLANV